MADNKLVLLAARYPHSVPVDPSVLSLLLQESYTESYVTAAILALIVYNACYVASSVSMVLVAHCILPTVTNLDKEVCLV